MSKKSKMANAPVYYALAQAQFNPILAMGKYINEIQDRLRRKGYVLFETQQITQLELGKVPGQDEPTVEKATSWLIIKEDRTAGFILTPSSLTFHTTHYETRDQFVPELVHALKAVHEVVSLDHLTRLGLRYLDAVLPSVNEAVSQYLVNGLYGIDFAAKKDYSLSEFAFQTESEPLITTGKLVVRVVQLASLLGYPPGLVPYGLVSMKRFTVNEPIAHAIIDTDHYVEGHMSLDFGKVEEQLFSLHAKIKGAFEAIITDHARSAWS